MGNVAWIDGNVRHVRAVSGAGERPACERRAARCLCVWASVRTPGIWSWPGPVPVDGSVNRRGGGCAAAALDD